MQKLWRDCKGAVTVFVTLLLIPAILVSGTAVDLARLYTAKSIVQDANQLAANTLLASYDAMLQDIYGLFAVMDNDPVLGELLNDYIKVTILGEDWNEEGLGTFQLFYGSNLRPEQPIAAPGQNLGDAQTLRRQIEEYAKFRAPVVIAEDILDKIESFQKLKADAEVIEKKMELDGKVEELEKSYKKVYEKIQEIEGYPAAQDSAFTSVNAMLDQICEQLMLLKSTRDQWTGAFKGTSIDRDDLMADCEQKYDDILVNIRALAGGGYVKTGWVDGGTGDDGLWKNGVWTGGHRSDGLNKKIGDAKSGLKKYRDKLDELVKAAEGADKKRDELDEQLKDLERKLAEGKCSKELRDGLNAKDSQGKSTMDQYRALLSYEIGPMAERMRGADAPVIQSAMEHMEGVFYGDNAGNDPTGGLSREALRALRQTAPGFAIDLEIRNETLSPKQEDVPVRLLGYGAGRYRVPQPGGFKRFEECGKENKAFYELLQSLFSGANDSKKSKVKDSLNKLLKTVQEKFKGIVLSPEGALHYQAGPKPDAEKGFGSEGDWSKEGEAQEKTKDALKGDLISGLGGLLDEAGNKILLLTYDTEMFSNYTTTAGDKTMAGIPMSVDVNYFFQSEQEYLYHGDLDDAMANHASVGGLLFLVRFVFNYISSFGVSEVNETVSAIKAATAFTGPFSFVIGELARVGIAMAESTLDLVNLRTGDEVALLKNNDTWEFSIGGLLNDLGELTVSSQSDIKGSAEKRKSGVGIRLSYSDYLRLFLLMRDGDVLAERTARLIELNVTNKKEKIGEKEGRSAREAAMTQAALFDMTRAITGFSITTTVDLRMLFLSMPLAQQGVRGVVPPKTLPVRATDYRGY